MASTSALFSQSPDNYPCAVRTHVGSDGKLRFGLARPNSTVHTCDWCCFDNFHVYRLNGTYTGINDINERQIENRNQIVNSKSSNNNYNLLGQHVSTPQHGQIYIIGGRKVLFK